jgi:hypothetical protein
MTAVYGEIFRDGQIYLLLYVYFAAAMIVEAVHDSVQFSRWVARISAVILILFIGLRWQTGTDWKAYINIFYADPSNADYDAVVYGVDTGYVIFNHIVYAISPDYTSLLLLTAIIAIGAVYYFIEKSTSLPNMGVYLFYTSYVVTHFMGSNRRMMAIGFVCLGFLFLAKDRRLRQAWPRWAIPFGIASTLHRTSVMALPALIIGRRAWPPSAVITGLLCCVVLGMSGAPFALLEALGQALSQFAHITVVDKLLFYTSGSDAQSAGDFDVMGQALMGVAKRSTILAIFISFMRYGQPSQYAQRLYNIYVVGCAIYFLMIGSPVFQVTSTYYTMTEVVLLPIIFSSVPQFKVPYIIYLLTMPLLLLISALTPYMDLYVPYRSIFTTY